MQDLKFTSYQKKQSSKPKTIIVLLHGYGSNSSDLISIAPDLEGSIEDTLFISVNAPFVYEGGGSNSYQWYSLKDRSLNAMLSGYEIAKKILHNFLSNLLENHSLTFNDLVLGGFSQGGMMSLQYGAQSPNKLKGIISCSGYIVDDGTFSQKVVNNTPILLTHGDQDTVVPLTSYVYSLKTLQSLNTNVVGYLSHGLAHGIDYQCLQAIQDFLKKL